MPGPDTTTMRVQARTRRNVGAFAALTQLLLLALLLLASAASAMEPLPFENTAQEQRFRALVAELRCVKCQNQSLADSDAPIAHDLRQEVFELMQEGRSDAQIKQFLVERYSEFVLYRPQVNATTWALWFGPALILLTGIVVIVLVVRRRTGQAPPTPPPTDTQEW